MTTTRDMTPAQLELMGSIAFKNARLSSFAPYIVGVWLDAFGIGLILALAARWYMTAAATDKPVTRVLVHYLVLLSIGTSAFFLAMTLDIFAKHFGEYSRFLSTTWHRCAYTIWAFSRCPCALFFTHRAWRLYNRNMWIPIIIGPAIIASAACSVGVTATLDRYPTPLLCRQLMWAFCATDVAVDVAITALLAYALHRKTGWEDTDRLITRLLRLVVETQTPPTITAIAFLLTSVLGGGNRLDTAYFEGAAKVHVICLIVVVTARVELGVKGVGEKRLKGVGKNGDTVELGSTSAVRVERTTYVHSGPRDNYDDEYKTGANRPHYLPQLGGRETGYAHAHGPSQCQSQSREGLNRDYAYAPSVHSHSKESDVSHVSHASHGRVQGGEEKGSRVWA